MLKFFNSNCLQHLTTLIKLCSNLRKIAQFQSGDRIAQFSRIQIFRLLSDDDFPYGFACISFNPDKVYTISLVAEIDRYNFV